MKIIREGKEIELTNSEVYDAYLEQQRIFDEGNISDHLDWALEYYDLDEKYDADKLRENGDFVRRAAKLFREYADKDCDFDYSVRVAVKKTIKEMEFYS